MRARISPYLGNLRRLGVQGTMVLARRFLCRRLCVLDNHCRCTLCHGKPSLDCAEADRHRCSALLRVRLLLPGLTNARASQVLQKLREKCCS